MSSAQPQPLDPLDQLAADDAERARRARSGPSRKRGPYRKRDAPSPAHLANAMKQLQRPEMRHHLKRHRLGHLAP